MGNYFCKTFGLCFLLLLISISTTPVYASPTTFGEIIEIDSAGNDPDIAVDSEGALHLAYVIGGSTFYRKVLAPYTDPNNIGDRIFVGKGTNPQIALDSLNNPHVIFGQAYYAFWTDPGFTQAGQAFDGWRKNFIAVDSKDQVYVVADKYSRREVLVRVYKDGIAISNAIQFAEDNPGGIYFDKEDRLWMAYRYPGNTSIRSYQFTDSPKGNYYDIHDRANSRTFAYKSGDFSTCSVNPLDDSIFILYTAAYSKGLYASVRRNESWDNFPLDAVGYGQHPRHDDVNPAAASDQDGYTYVTFAGLWTSGYYMVYDSNYEVQPYDGDLLKDEVGNRVIRFDLDYVGVKLTNPNVASRPDMSGAYIAWGSDKVQVASIGDVSYGSFTSLSPIYGLLFQTSTATTTK